MKTYGGVDVLTHIFLISALVGGELHAPAALPPGKEPTDTHWIGGWVGPRASLDDVEKRKFLILPGLELRPVACSHTLSRLFLLLSKLNKLQRTPLVIL
jgi:hypothetical protein